MSLQRQSINLPDYARTGAVGSGCAADVDQDR